MPQEYLSKFQLTNSKNLDFNLVITRAAVLYNWTSSSISYFQDRDECAEQVDNYDKGNSYCINSIGNYDCN